MNVLFDIYEVIYSKLYGVTELPGDNIYRIQLKVWKGKPLKLRDGTVVNSGDMTLAIHLKNDLARSLKRKRFDFTEAVHLTRRAQQSTARIAAMLRDEERYSGVKAVEAKTLLGGIAEKLGFESREIENPVALMLLNLYEGWLLRRSRVNRDAAGGHNKARTVWISNERLQYLYPPGEREKGVAASCQSLQTT